MAKYCDPRILESVWSKWLVAAEVPSLENVRGTGALWTKREDSTLLHWVTTTSPYKFASHGGNVEICDLNNAIRASFYPLDVVLVRQASSDNYQCEVPAQISWDELTAMIYKVCCGVVLNFRPPSGDIRDELIHEAFTHTLTKIQRGRLKFTPGRAPVFNLLTTTIFRIMYSIKNKEKRTRDHRSHLVEQLLDNAPLPDLNSIKVSQSLASCCSGHLRSRTIEKRNDALESELDELMLQHQ